MWQAVGARGPPWAAGGAVPNGEVVTVLGAHLEHDCMEGGFVRVQRASGHEGYMKIKNLHAPVTEGMTVVGGQDLLICRSDGGYSSTGVWPNLGEGRGKWVGSIENGEIVKAIEGPCSSASEGFFMRIQR